MSSASDINASELLVETLGTGNFDSPLHRFSHRQGSPYRFITEGERVLVEDNINHIRALVESGQEIPSVEVAGPRSRIFFDPELTGMAVVTCGGLCPGLNNVIRALVLEAFYRYGIRRIYGIQNGFRGFIPEYGYEPLELSPDMVANIHHFGGTILSSSRGRQDEGRIVDWLERKEVGLLFVIGGDGSQRAALDIHKEAKRRGAKISVIGIPKTIDNDMLFLDKSFGFETAFSRAVEAITCAHAEAKGVMNGVGLVKVMGRHSGFIACHAALARSDVNFVLIPEVPFEMEGERGFLAELVKRLHSRHHSVIVIAEGAGQHLLQETGKTDASGNQILGDIGIYMRDRIEAYLHEKGVEGHLKYMDPSYLIRSVPADPQDSLYCSRLAQSAVHAAMAGKTGMIVGRWRQNYVHMPIHLVTASRQVVDADGDLWQSVLACTGQPAYFN
ncbi:MAG: ATP-dependent 6-phosphofructokinase [Chthoniobacterales bacterium]